MSMKLAGKVVLDRAREMVTVLRSRAEAEITDIPVAVLTNGSLLGDPRVRRDLCRADIVVLNTCVVRQSAEDRAIGYLSSLKPLKARNPGLIYCEISGFGRSGPYAERGGACERGQRPALLLDHGHQHGVHLLLR